MQSKVIPIKKLLKDNNLDYKNFEIDDKTLSFKVNNIEKFELIFFSKKDNLVNPYIDNYRSFELDFDKLKNNSIKISFSKFGLLTINNSALKQSIEIVRRRIDDGDEEPTILNEGNNICRLCLKDLKE